MFKNETPFDINDRVPFVPYNKKDELQKYVSDMRQKNAKNNEKLKLQTQPNQTRLFSNFKIPNIKLPTKALPYKGGNIKTKKTSKHKTRKHIKPRVRKTRKYRKTAHKK